MPSKLSTARSIISRGIFDELTSFTELEGRISALGDENTKILGDAFEIFVEAYLATQPKFQVEEVFLVGQVPLDIRQQMNLPNDTKGIDGIFRTRTGTPVPYQVKFRSKRAYLTYTEVTPFLGLTERASDRLIFTNSDEVAVDAKNRDAMRTVRGIDFDELTADDFGLIEGWLKEVPVTLPKPVPRDYQMEALDKICAIELHSMDVDFPVDTDPKTVRRFLERPTEDVKVVFSTYQSSKVFSEGARGLAAFDLGIFDEDHKTTGPKGGLFAHSLFDENIRIRKRLFLTATPRHYDIRHRDKEGDFKVVSMDDEAIYGPRAYTLTFGEAAGRGIICNYKVVISAVDDKEINQFAIEHGITLIEGDLIGTKWVANQIAVERAIEKTEAKRAITFHSRVSSAKEFSSDSTRGLKQFLNGFSVFHVSGSQKSSERKQVIKMFRDAPNAVITNARCLTEGIDVPSVDMVAFIDPRHSLVDIAQATGRAMRKPRESDKSTGYVVVPLFLERRSSHKLEEVLEHSDFADVSNVVNAMREQDEDLAQIISELKEAKGRGDVFNPNVLAEKIELIGPSIELAALRSNIFAEIIDTIGVSWDEWFGRLKGFKQREGHCRVPLRFSANGFNLGNWVGTQRRQARALSHERLRRLNEIGFIWDPFEEDWEQGFSIHSVRPGRRDFAISNYSKNARGTARLFVADDGFKLGSWVHIQRL
jgi:predicted helicase